MVLVRFYREPLRVLPEGKPFSTASRLKCGGEKNVYLVSFSFNQWTLSLQEGEAQISRLKADKIPISHKLQDLDLVLNVAQ